MITKRCSGPEPPGSGPECLIFVGFQDWAVRLSLLHDRTRRPLTVKETAVFLTGYDRSPRPTQLLASIGKETQSRNQRQVRKPSHGFLYDS